MQSAPNLDIRSTSDAKARAAGRGRLVTDAPTRMFHWLFALSFVGAYLTAESEHWRALHVTLGYTFASLLAFRILYGLLGPRQVRIALMWRKLDGLRAWVVAAAQSRSLTGVNWRQGQNLLMTLTVAALLAMVVPLALSGYATYSEWGGEWLEELHEFFANAFLALVLVHLTLIAASSLLRRKNQALPMLSGRIDGPGPDLVRHNRLWLAVALLTATLAFGTWVWPTPPDGLASNTGWSGGSRHHGDDD